MTIPFDSMEVPLDQLYLDPNNYRFIDHDEYKHVPETDIKLARIQKRTLNLIAGKKDENINDLLQSLTSNGYLPVDQIQVKPIDGGGYLVLEGNRRVTALKKLQERYENEADIGSLDPEFFLGVPVVSLEAEEGQQKIVLGLKHISGNRKWPAINQAQFLWDLMNRHNTSEDIVTASLGISKRKLRQSLRTLALINEYKKSDFGDQFKTDMYTIFEEIIRIGVMHDWIGWDNHAMKSSNIKNRDRLFSWLSEEEIELGFEDDEGEPAKEKLSRIITKYTDIRDIAKFIGDEDALKKMEDTRSLAQAYGDSDRVKESLLHQSIENVEKQISAAAGYLRFAKTEDRTRLKNVLAALTHLVADQGMPDILDNQFVPRHIHNDRVANHFTNVTIRKYKKIDRIVLDNINKINIIAGVNNAGKSTLLEAIYLLTRQNDIYGFFDLYRKRGKFQTLNQLWLHQQEINGFNISGIFNQEAVFVTIDKFEESDETIDKSSYLSTLRIFTQIQNQIYESKARLYKNRDVEVFFKNILLVCNSVYSSPFSQYDNQEIIAHHEKSVESMRYVQIVDFLRGKVDGNIVNIDLAGELKRFLVAHNQFANAVDITQFGEGMQRMFHIALQFASARNGVLLIDELENAIHYTLLRDFTVLIRRLADIFNVQVFVTTHSKECIDAFLNNGISNKDISAYRLVRTNGIDECQYISGEDLALLSHSINLDLRGGE